MSLQRLTRNIGFAFLGLAGLCSAQTEEPERGSTFSVGGGFTAITGRDAGKLDHGGNIQVGGGYFLNRYLGVTGNFMFNGLGITRSALDSLNEPDGGARVYTLTVDPTVRMPLGGGNSVYVLAGGGYLRRTVEFTQPVLAQTFVFDPWWGFFGPALIPVNQVLGSVSDNAGMYNVGAGVNFRMPRTRLKLFVEARYMHGFTSNTNTTIIPISVGIRK